MKPQQIEIGEWLYKGCFIQQQNHPLLTKYIVFENTETQSHVGTATNFKDAKKLCYDVKNQKFTAKDFLS